MHIEPPAPNTTPPVEGEISFANTHVLIYNTEKQFNALKSLNSAIDNCATMFQNNMVVSTEDIAKWQQDMQNIQNGITVLRKSLDIISKQNTISVEDAVKLDTVMRENEGKLPWLENKD